MSPSAGKNARPLVALAGLLLAGAAGAPALQAADFHLRPTLSLSEEFNDNIRETESDQRRDWVSRVRPGVSFNYLAPDFSTDLAYNFDYRYYARGSHGNDSSHALNLRTSAALTDRFLFLDLTDTLSRVTLNVARDVTSESLFLNQSDQNVAAVSPYLLWKPGEKTLLKTGYRFSDTRYWSDAGIDKREHSAFADLSQETTARLGWNASYSYRAVQTDLVDYDEHDVSASANYEFAEKSFLYGGIGNSWQDFSHSLSASHLFWHAGISSDLVFLVAVLEARLQYTEDPLSISTRQTSYSVRLDKIMQHGALGLTVSYSEFRGAIGSLGTRSSFGALQALGLLPDRNSLAVGATGRYDFSEWLSANLSAAGDRVTGQLIESYPYHMNLGAGLASRFNNELSAALRYNHIEYRRQWDSASGAREINRVVLELTKVFGP
jgi:hypothetical protein